MQHPLWLPLFGRQSLVALGLLLLTAPLPAAQQRAGAPAGGGQRGAGRGAAVGSPPRDAQGRADLSGMWMQGGGVAGLRSDPVPYTPEAQTKAEYFRNRRNIDDPMGMCLLVGIP